MVTEPKWLQGRPSVKANEKLGLVPFERFAREGLGGEVCAPLGQVSIPRQRLEAGTLLDFARDACQIPVQFLRRLDPGLRAFRIVPQGQ